MIRLVRVVGVVWLIMFNSAPILVSAAAFAQNNDAGSEQGQMQSMQIDRSKIE